MRPRVRQLLIGLAAAVLAVVAATCGYNSSRHAANSAPVVVAGGEGAELYERYCALCHGKQGEGYAADNANALANQEFLSSVTDQFLRVAIVRGRVDTPMSAWGKRYGGPLDGPDVEKLIKFIRGWQTTPSVQLPPSGVGNAQPGGDLFRKRCASCHGPAGEGKKAPSLSNPIFQSTASNAFIRYAIEKGRSGTPMPSFVRALSQREIDDIIAYIRTLRRQGERRPAPKPPPLPEGPIVINPKGPPPKFELRDDFYVPAAQLKAALDAGARLIIADARAQSDYLEAHIPGAISLPFFAVETLAPKLPKDGTWIIAYCACPHAASGRVARALQERGFPHVAVLDEGIMVWKQLGYPTAQGQ